MSNISLRKQIELASAFEDLYVVAKEFVERVEKGEVKSVKTYNRFKEIIEVIESV